MADNTTLPLTGSGDATAVYADDDIAGVKYPRVKLVIGANGTNDGDVASGNPLPVSLASVPSHAVTLSTSIKNAYVASSAVTISPASLATDSNFLAGRESTAIDNSSNKYTDYLLSGQITTGTSPTVDKEIRVYVVGISNDSTWPDVFDGTDSAETITNAGIRDSVCKLASVMVVTATSNVSYWFGPVSVASLFGGVVPLKFVVFITHNTAVNLNATAGNHVVSITPVYRTLS